MPARIVATKRAARATREVIVQIVGVGPVETTPVGKPDSGRDDHWPKPKVLFFPVAHAPDRRWSRSKKAHATSGVMVRVR